MARYGPMANRFPRKFSGKFRRTGSPATEGASNGTVQGSLQRHWFRSNTGSKGRSLIREVYFLY